ncbi:MAG: TSUP family transporter [Planctomycetota bacterium]
MGPTEYAAIAALGAGVGLIAGAFGVGGGFLLVPLLTGLIGVPVETAVASVGCFLLGPTTTALRARRAKLFELRLPVTVAGGLLVGVLAGAAALDAARGDGTTRLGGLSTADAVVCVLDALLFAALTASRLMSPRGKERSPPRFVAFGPTRRFAGLEDAVSVPLLCWAATFVGAAAGLLGIAGGVIVLPALTQGLGMSVREASKASLAIVWIASLQATVVHAAAGRVELGVVVALLACGPAAAFVGSRVAGRLPDRVLGHGLTGLLAAMAALSAGRVAFGVLATPG